MTRPLTCLTLLAAAGAGLYLYQTKHQAQLQDREINRVVHEADQARERTDMLRAEWALLNDPERLQTLAASHLALQTIVPGQFVQLAELSTRLPAVTPPDAVAPARPVDETPVAEAEPAMPLKAPLMVQTAPAPVLPRPSAPLIAQATPPATPAPAVQVAAGRSRPVRMAAARPVEREREAVRRPVYAPILPAFASPMQRQAIHAPMVQQAAAEMPSEPRYVGSALGMAHTVIAPPVPMSTTLGNASGR